MKAEILDSAASPPCGEVNYRQPVPASSPPRRRWRMSIALSLGLLVLAASFAIAVLSLHSRADHPSASSASASIPVETPRWNSAGYVDIEGGVTPLYPLQLGRVKSIEARENEFVKAGTPLFHLENPVLFSKVPQAESALEGARKQLAIAEAGVEEASKQIEAQKTAIDAARQKVELAHVLLNQRKRFEKLEIEGEKGAVRAAEIAVEQAELGVKGEEAKLAIMEVAKRKAEEYVAVAQVNIEGKRALLDEARNAVKECVVRAPVDGTPLRILVAVGETLGANPRQPAIQFAAARPLLVRAEVGREFAGYVQLGQKVIVQDDITYKECARGKVASLALWYAPHRTLGAETMSLSNDNRTLECIIQLEAPSPSIRIGQRVSVRFPD